MAIGMGVCIYLYFRTKHHLKKYAEEVGESSDISSRDELADTDGTMPPDQSSPDQITLDRRGSLLDSHLDEEAIQNEDEVAPSYSDRRADSTRSGYTREILPSDQSTTSRPSPETSPLSVISLHAKELTTKTIAED